MEDDGFVVVNEEDLAETDKDDFVETDEGLVRVDVEGLMEREDVFEELEV